MYSEHPFFLQPADENSKVWHYTNFVKFISMLEKQSLFFNRADKFNDLFEGSYPKINTQNREKVPKELPATKSVKRALHEVAQQTTEMHKIWRKYVALNCWHLNDHESAAMWSLYSRKNDGVALQTTYAKLKESLIAEKFFLGKVQYIDYERSELPDNHLLVPFIHKRESYEHEQEVRAVIMKPPFRGDQLDFDLETINNGLYISVDLNILLETVFVAPDTPDWFLELVEKMKSRYDKQFLVKRTPLIDGPFF